MSELGIPINSLPLTPIGIPVATVCPLAVRPVASNASFAHALNADGAEAFQPVSLPTASVNDTASSMITASAKMPDGAMTTFSSLVRREVEVPSAPEAPIVLPNGVSAIQLSTDDPVDTAIGQIVIGPGGCQTLYSPTVTAICSTVISPVGIPPVTVTDCDQYITFSSETLFSCALTPTISPLLASSDDGKASTYTLPDDSFTTRPFPPDYPIPSPDTTDSTVSTVATDDEANFASSVSTSTPNLPITADSILPLTRRDLIYSRAPSDDIPMSLPRHLLPENQLKKRQVLISNGTPFSTDPMTMTPDATMEEEMEMATTTAAPEPTDSLLVRDDVLTTGFASVSRPPVVAPFPPVDSAPLPLPIPYPVPINATFNETLNGTNITTTANVSDSAGISFQSLTSLLPVPEVLRAKYTRQAIRAIFHERQSDNTDDTNAQPNTDANTDPADSNVSTSAQPTDDAAITSIPTVSDSSMLPADNTIRPPVRAVNLSPPQPTKYYAAPWYELTGGNGAIPTNVKGITCRSGLEPAGSCVTPDTDGDPESCECEVDDEIWSITSVTRTRVGTTMVGFDGGVVVSLSGFSLTTSISFTQAVTTTREDVVGSVVRSTITSSSGDDATVYATETTYPSVTMTLLPGDGISPNDVTNVTAVDAAAPQSSPASISYATDISAKDSPISSISMPVDASDPNTDIEGTTLVTSTVATETVTVPPPNIAGASTIEPVPAEPTEIPVSDSSSN